MNLSTFSKELKSLSKLAYPILIAQLVQNLMGFVDTVMAGRVSSTDMAAVAVATSIWFPLILSIYGIMMALAAIVSQHAGAEKYKEVARATFQTAWIAIFLSLTLILAFYLIAPNIYDSVTMEPKLKSLMFDYLGYIIWGAPGFCLYFVLRNFSEGMSHTKPTMIISIVGLLINIPTNYIFIYGAFGAPALGGAGCGVATAIVYWAMFLVTLAYSYRAKALQKVPLFSSFYWPNWQEISRIFSLGIPISLSLLFEVTLFSVVALILTPFGAEVVASHQVALSFSGLVFMVPLSIAMAVTIKVGFAVGEKRYEQAKQLTIIAIALGLFIAIFTAAASILFREQIAGIYTKEAAVLTLAAKLMFLASLFQFSDAIQVISAGALRGYKDTKSVLYITFVSYWLVGLTIGLILGITDWVVPQMGPFGFWIGFITGLTTAAILLAWRLKVVQKTLRIECFNLSI